MRHLVAVAGLLLLGLANCAEKKDITPFVYRPPVTEKIRDSTAVPPTLLSVNLEGIPAANVRIDNLARVVYVTVPTDIVTATPVAKLVSSVGSRISRPLGSPVSPIRFVLGQNYESFDLVYYSRFDILNGTVYPYDEKRITYAVRSLPVDDMLLLPGAYAEAGQTTYLPIRNYYDSVSLDATIRLTAVADRRVIEGWGRTQVRADEPIIPAGMVAFTSNQLVTPGEYTVEVEKVNRSGLTRRLSGGRLTLRPGRPAFDNRYNTTVVTERGDVSLTGFNFYPATPVEVELVSQTGTRLTLTPTNYAPDGSRLTLPLPANVPPGYYQVRFRRAGQVLNVSRLLLSPDERAVFIRAIWNEANVDITPSEQPIIIQRTTPLGLTVSLATGRLQLRLTAVADDRKTYLLPLPYNWSSYCFECGSLFLGNLSLADVPPGQYQMSVVSEKSDSDLGAFDRLIQLQ